MVEAGERVGGEGTRAAAESPRQFGVKNWNIERTEREMQSNKVSADAQIIPPSIGAPGDGVQRSTANVFGYFRPIRPVSPPPSPGIVM
jgi:hypothetical protein